MLAMNAQPEPIENDAAELDATRDDSEEQIEIDRVLVAPCPKCGRVVIAETFVPPILFCRCGGPLVLWIGAPSGTSITEGGAIEYPNGHAPWKGRAAANDNGRGTGPARDSGARCAQDDEHGKDRE